MVARLHFCGDVENRLLNAVQVHAGQFDRGVLVAGLDVLDQPQMLVVAAGLVAVIVQCGGIQRGAGDQFLNQSSSTGLFRLRASLMWNSPSRWISRS